MLKNILKRKTIDESKVGRNDILAIERTKLANERTFLAYFRTCIVFTSSALVILKVELLKNLSFLSYSLLVIAAVLLLIGVIRFIYVRRKIRKYYH
ncbi:MAG: DUF202 domain-containing protein [Bacteroidota bacterium]